MATPEECAEMRAALVEKAHFVDTWAVREAELDSSNASAVANVEACRAVRAAARGAYEMDRENEDARIRLAQAEIALDSAQAHADDLDRQLAEARPMHLSLLAAFVDLEARIAAECWGR